MLISNGSPLSSKYYGDRQQLILWCRICARSLLSQDGVVSRRDGWKQQLLLSSPTQSRSNIVGVSQELVRLSRRVRLKQFQHMCQKPNRPSRGSPARYRTLGYPCCDHVPDFFAFGATSQHRQNCVLRLIRDRLSFLHRYVVLVIFRVIWHM